MQRLVPSDATRALDVLVGDWTVEVPDPRVGQAPVRGSSSIAWLKSGVVLVEHATMEAPEYPDGITFYGTDAESGRLVAHSWDSRGVVREWNVSLEDGVFRRWRDLVEGESFAQRLALEIGDGGDRMEGLIEMARDGRTFESDFHVVMRRTGR